MRGAAMSLTPAVSGLVFLLTATVVHSLNGWGVNYVSTSICALKGSTVEMYCTYSHPLRENNQKVTVEERFWFRKDSQGVVVDLRTDPEYTGRVEDHCENNKCSLRIRDLRESDSADYKFRFTTNLETGKFSGLPGVTLSVTDLQVQVSRSVVKWSSKQADLRCQSRCLLPANPSYIWYKNGQIIAGRTSDIYSIDWNSETSVSCAVENQEKSLSPPVLVLKSPYEVIYSSAQICAFKGSTVEINCTYRYPSRVNYIDTRVTNTFWFIQQSYPILDRNGRFEHRCNENKCTLRIRDLRESDSAEYKFRFTTNHDSYSGVPGVTLSVKDPRSALQISMKTSISNQNRMNWMELTCQSNCQLPPHSSFIFYKNGNIIQQEKNYLLLQTVDSSNSYYCAVKDQEQLRSERLYISGFPSVSVSPSGEILEGRSVTLSCTSRLTASYTWYKKSQPNPGYIRVGQQLIFSSIQSSDSGEYFCVADTNQGRRWSGYHSIDVKYAPKLPSVSVSPSGEIMEGRSGISEKMVNIVRLSLVVLLLIPLIFLSLWTRKKKLQRRQTDQSEGVEMREVRRLSGNLRIL